MSQTSDEDPRGGEAATQSGAAQSGTADARAPDPGAVDAGRPPAQTAREDPGQGSAAAAGGRVDVLSRENGVQGDKINFFRIDKVVARVKRPSGDWGPTVSWEILERHDETAVLLYETDTHRVLLVRQFRAPMLNRLGDAAAEEAFLCETVAGMIDAGESPEAAATRETLEETGHRLARLEPVCLFYTTPGGSSERIYLFLGEVRADDRPEAGGGLRSEGEAIELVSLSPEALAEEIAAGRVYDAKILLAAPALERALDRPLAGPSPETVAHLATARRRVTLRLVSAAELGEGAAGAADRGAAATTIADRVAAVIAAPGRRSGAGPLFSWRRGGGEAAREINASRLRRGAGLDRRGLAAILEAIVDQAEDAAARGVRLDSVAIGVDSVGDYQCAMDWMRRSARLSVAAAREAPLLARPPAAPTPL